MKSITASSAGFNIRFLLVFIGLKVISGAAAQAQIVDGDFSSSSNGGFGSAWNLLGVPSVQQSNVPTPGSSAALIESTNSSTTDPYGPAGPVDGANAVSATDIKSTLGVTLPANGFLGRDTPTDGEAIYQTFHTAAATTLSFAWSYATYDASPLDSVGYVLNGSYTELEATPQNPQPTPSGYTTTTIAIPQGMNTLAFVAYNTGDTTYDTELYVTDVELAPEQPTWLLFLSGAIALGAFAWATARSRFLRVLLG